MIEKDVRITVGGALSLIGGTMGLFSGFSILSGVEILFYGVKYGMTLWKKTSLKKKEGEHMKN